ncbi:TonB-dependent receptor domain-containing protein [Halarcobacter sp.]|uniref:TonB-dependent receptor plug domain-containing protein n=1 Tax=Halarcobacter sp. TaxID=2321133 RepID=UPI002AAA7EED|nr:TonB-dependent receptor [Halarcobacter sp.]
MENKKITTSLVAGLLLATNLFSQELSTITIVSATKSEQSIKDITSNVDVITKQDIEERHFTSVIDALNSLPGITFTSNGGIGSTVSLNLRGSSNNRTLILIDGVKFKDHSSISGTDISSLMVTDIERIEVIKGAQSGIWGADAAAGVINIITKDAKDGFHGFVSTEVGSFDTHKFATQLSYKNEDFDLKFDAQKIESDSFSSQAIRNQYLDVLENDEYDNTTLSLKGNYYINDSAKLNFSVVDIDSLKAYDSSGPNDVLMKNDSNTKIYNLGFEQKYKNHNISFSLEKTKTKRDQQGTTWGVKLTDNETTNVELSDTISYFDNDFLLLGMGAGKDEMDYTKADRTSNFASNKTKYFYATNSNSFGDLILTESLRYDAFDNFDNKLTGKVGAKYNLTSDFSLFANAGTSYSVPLLINNINPWGSTNFNIEPETSKSYDIGFEYEDFKFTYFYQKVDDLIDWYDPTPLNYFNNDAIYINQDGTSKFEGVEISYKRNFLDDFLLSLSYTRLSAKNKDNQYLARRPKDDFKFGLDYYGFKDLHLNINGEYIGDRFEQLDKKGTQTGRYTVWNAVANYTLTKDVTTFLKVENMFDKYYQVVDGYASSPRSVTVGLKYSF